MTDQEIRIRTLERQNRKLQERLNRIKNTMIGNARIWELDRLVMECEVNAQEIEDAFDATDMTPMRLEQVRQHRADALFLRRLQYDLRDQHTAINDLQSERARDVDYVAGKYDPDNWRGPRP